MVKFYISREHYFINAQKSAEVELSKVASCGKDDGMPTLGEDKIQRIVSEVHLGLIGTAQEVLILMSECKWGEERCTP